MKKKYIVLSIAGVLIVVISFGVGYAFAYLNGMRKVIYMDVTTHSTILARNSIRLIEKLKTPDIAELIEAMEENGDSLSSDIIFSKQFIKNPETLKLIEITQTRWEKAKERLHELKDLQSNSPINAETGN